jgi:hypothetical protein
MGDGKACAFGDGLTLWELMGKGVITLLLALLCISSRAQSSNVFDALSPGLQQFLNEHPAAGEVLSNVVNGDFANKAVRLVYFHPADQFMGRSHYQVTNNIVVISIGDSAVAADEFIELYFEVKNSEHAGEVQKLLAKILSGTTTRDIFAHQMLQLEFAACQATRDMLSVLKDDDAIVQAPLYKNHSECPDSFEEFIPYLQRIYAGHAGPLENFGRQFDEVQRSRGITNAE